MLARSRSKILALAATLSSLAMPLRLAIGAIVTLLAGAGVGFFAEYAAYRWALYYGIRPPMEGIPYLKVAVTAMTASVLLGGAIVFTVVQSACSGLIRYLDGILGGVNLISKLLARFGHEHTEVNSLHSLIVQLREVRPSIAILGSAVLAFLIAVIEAALRLRLLNFNDTFESVLVGVGLFAFMMLAWKPTLKLWFSLFAVAASVIIGPLLLFNTDIYGQLLRTLGYGGGAPIIVVVQEETTSISTKTNVSGSLMLRTTSSLILYQQDERRFREIPLSQVLFIDSQADTREPPKFVLPLPRK